MRVFVAGASGALGRPLLRQLVAAGHEVTGTTRREQRAEQIRAAGATAVVCDVFDAAAFEAAVVEARPEVVVHVLTALPDRFEWKRDPIGPTNRLRSEGTRNLLNAARAAGARRVIAESVAFFYAPEGGWIKDEEAPLNVSAPAPFGEAADALEDLERQVSAATGIEGVVMRFGWFYGPGTHFAADGFQAEEVRKRRMPIVGDGRGTFSFVHVEDAAAATVAALDHGQTGTYNVVDDEPAPMRDWVPIYAEAIGARRPLQVPLWLAKLIAGRAVAANVASLRGASNTKAKRELDWQPRYSSWRQGFREALG